MKTIIQFSTVFLLATMILSSCSKTEHYIRFINQSSKDYKNVVIDPNNYGIVTSGQSTQYLKIPEGSGNVSGISADSTKKLIGTYEISGGNHKDYWTFTLLLGGGTELSRDNK